MIAPVLVPVAPGANFIVTTQFAPLARVAGQLFVCVKSPLAVIEIPLMFPFPPLVKMVVCVALIVPTSWREKVRVEGERVAGGEMPVPLNAASCGLLDAELEIVSVPLRVPNPVGVKVADIVQAAPAAMLLPQLLVCA